MFDDTPLRRCSKCQRALPVTPEFFSPRKDSKTGFRSDCRECENKRKKAYRADNPDKVREKAKRYRTKNAEKLREYMRQWRASNPDKMREYKKRWQQANPDKARETQREKSKRWQQANPDKVRSESHRRRARKRNLLATFTVTDWQQALTYFDGRCAYCGRPAGLWHTLAQDHFIALANGGAYTPDNIVPACHGDGGCNNSKHDRDPQEWLTEKLGKRKALKILARIETYFEWVRERDG